MKWCVCLSSPCVIIPLLKGRVTIHAPTAMVIQEYAFLAAFMMNLTVIQLLIQCCADEGILHIVLLFSSFLTAGLVIGMITAML